MNETSPLLLSIVVPILNEADNIDALLHEIEEVLPSVGGRSEVILVDDGSLDGSWQKIEEASRRYRWVRGLRFLANRGQTAAMVAGIDAARGKLVAFLDADLQNDPHDIPKLMAPVLEGRADLVCGWRAHREDNLLLRTFPSKLANLLIRSAFRIEVHDLGCTLKVGRKVFLEDIQLYGEMHRFIPVYAQAQGARIAEETVNHRPRARGVSKYGLGRIWKVLVDLLTVKMLNSYGSKPAYFFGKIGLTFFGLGLAAFALTAYRAVILGKVEATPMIFIMLLMFITSLICMMSGLLAEINIRVLHQVGSRRSYRVIEEVGDPQATSVDQR